MVYEFIIIAWVLLAILNGSSDAMTCRLRADKAGLFFDATGAEDDHCHQNKVLHVAYTTISLAINFWWRIKRQ